MIAFLYARVSTGEQNEGMQLREMQEYATARKWQQELFVDTGVSGAKESRPELDRMMRLARKRKCGVVLVYKFDRFARSLRHLLNALEEFEARGVEFVSIHDDFDMTTATGRLMFKMVGAFAEFERDIIRQRVRSGMATAKQEILENGQTRRGKTHIGRPSLMLDAREIASLRAQGLPWREVSARVGAGISTCKRELRKACPKGLCKTEENSDDSTVLTGAN